MLVSPREVRSDTVLPITYYLLLTTYYLLLTNVLVSPREVRSDTVLTHGTCGLYEA